MGIAEVYAGKALVELVDVDRLFDRKVSKRDKVRETNLLGKAGARFRKANDHFTAAAAACLTVSKAAPDDEKLLLAEDIKAFKEIAKGISRLASSMERGILPPNEPIHGITAMIRDQDVIAERRAVAYQGLPGHLPKGY